MTSIQVEFNVTFQNNQPNSSTFSIHQPVPRSRRVARRLNRKTPLTFVRISFDFFLKKRAILWRLNGCSGEDRALCASSVGGVVSFLGWWRRRQNKASITRTITAFASLIDWQPCQWPFRAFESSVDLRRSLEEPHVASLTPSSAVTNDRVDDEW